MLALTQTSPFSNLIPEVLGSIAQWSNPLEMQILLVVNKAWNKIAHQIIDLQKKQEVQEIKDFIADVTKLCPEENKEWISKFTECWEHSQTLLGPIHLFEPSNCSRIDPSFTPLFIELMIESPDTFDKIAREAKGSSFKRNFLSLVDLTYLIANRSLLGQELSFQIVQQIGNNYCAIGLPEQGLKFYETCPNVTLMGSCRFFSDIIIKSNLPFVLNRSSSCPARRNPFQQLCVLSLRIARPLSQCGHVERAIEILEKTWREVNSSDVNPNDYPLSFQSKLIQLLPRIGSHERAIELIHNHDAFEKINLFMELGLHSEAQELARKMDDDHDLKSLALFKAGLTKEAEEAARVVENPWDKLLALINIGLCDETIINEALSAEGKDYAMICELIKPFGFPEKQAEIALLIENPKEKFDALLEYGLKEAAAEVARGFKDEWDRCNAFLKLGLDQEALKTLESITPTNLSKKLLKLQHLLKLVSNKEALRFADEVPNCEGKIQLLLSHGFTKEAEVIIETIKSARKLFRQHLEAGRLREALACANEVPDDFFKYALLRAYQCFDDAQQVGKVISEMRFPQ